MIEISFSARRQSSAVEKALDYIVKVCVPQLSAAQSVTSGKSLKLFKSVSSSITGNLGFVTSISVCK